MDLESHLSSEPSPPLNTTDDIEAVFQGIHEGTSGCDLEEFERRIRKVDVSQARSEKGELIVVCAARANRPDIVELLARIDPSSLRIRDQSQRTLFHLCLDTEQIDPMETVKALLGVGLSGSLPDAQGWTPLHLAAKLGHYDSLSELLKTRCNPNAQNSDGDTPLHLAVRYRRLKCMEVLLAAGASQSLINYTRRTAKQEASGAALAVLSKHEKPVKSKIPRRWEETKPSSNYSWHKTEHHLAKTSSSQEPGRPIKDLTPVPTAKTRENEEKSHTISVEKQIELERKAKDDALNRLREVEQSLSTANSELQTLKEQLTQMKAKSEVKLLFPKSLCVLENVLPQLQVDMEQFTEEVKSWQTACTPAYEKAIRQLRTEVKSMWPDCDFEAYGSFANTLHLPGSDIDLVIVGPSTPTQLSELSQSIRLHVPVTSMSLVATAFIPVLKVEMTVDSLDIRIDITQQDPRHTGVKCSQVVKQKIEAIPRLREVNLVVKHLFQLCDFTEPFKGGISSYGIFLMVLYFFQHHLPPCEEKYNLAEPLLHFLNFYSWNFNYHDAICVDEAVYDPTYFPQSMDPYLVIVDPISPTRNVGHNTNLEGLLVILRLATKYLQREGACKCQSQVLLNMLQETKSAISWS